MARRTARRRDCGCAAADNFAAAATCQHSSVAPPRPDSDDEEEDCGAAEHWAPRISRRGVPAARAVLGERADSPPIQSKLIAKPAPLKMAPLALQRSGVSDLLFNMDFNKNNDSSSLNPPSALASVPATAEPAARQQLRRAPPMNQRFVCALFLAAPTATRVERDADLL